MASKTKLYIEKAKKQHNRYDYSQITELLKRDMKVNIICPIHGIFEQSFHKHLSGDGCKKCGIEIARLKRIQKAKILFIKLYENTIIKEEFIKKNGYNLIVIWEQEWKIFKKQ